VPRANRHTASGHHECRPTLPVNNPKPRIGLFSLANSRPACQPE